MNTHTHTLIQQIKQKIAKHLNADYLQKNLFVFSKKKKKLKCQFKTLMNFNSRGIKKTAKTCIISLKTIIIIRKKQSVRNFQRQLNEPPLSNAKECSNYHTIAFISHSSKVIPQILQARLQKYMNRELPDVQAGFTKGRGTRDQIARIHWRS